MTWLWIAIVSALLVYVIVVLRLRDKRKVCSGCERSVPIDFLEEIYVGGTLAGGVRSPLVACRHCLYAEDYPK